MTGSDKLCKVESFAIHESYQPWNGPNFDICLIKTSESIYEGSFSIIRL